MSNQDQDLPRPPDADESTRTDYELDLTGKRLGAYRLDRLLGRGGMGAVYLASRDDGEFDKRVAIKVINPSAATPALLKRFRVERQILASIEHPHIARLLDGGTAAGGLPFFVMEYVEGETLARVLARGPLPLSRALEVAAALADVLALIHAKGLVFRDLKPSNVMIDTQSRLKLLDFGIAKITRGDVGEPPDHQTRAGGIVGTPRYMSPEQARGEPAEASSDVFSFGVVLFEALTGQLPFDSAARRSRYRDGISTDTRALPGSFPRPVRELVDRCLRDAPEERYASGAELAAAVSAIVKGASGEVKRASGLRYMWLAVAAAITLVAIWLGWTGRNGQGGAPPAPSASQPLVTWASDEKDPRVSPDLRWLSFRSDRDGQLRLWLRDRASGEERVVTPPGGELIAHEWSPSSDRIAYVTKTSTGAFLNVCGIAPGARPEVFAIRGNGALVRWIGTGIYYLADDSLWRLDLGTGQSREVTIARGSHSLRGVDVSKDERHIVFTAYDANFIRLWYADLDGGNAVALTETRIDPRFPRWKGPGSDSFLYVSEENGQADIWLMDVSTRQRRPLTISGAREERIDVSDDGSVLVYQQIAQSAAVASLDPMEKPPGITSLTSDSLSDLAPSASASGRVVVFQRAKRENLSAGIYDATVRIDRDGFTTEPEAIGDGYAPEISPDGRWVAYLTSPRSKTTSLRIYDMQTRRTVSVSDSFAKPIYRLFPMAWTKVNLAWSPTRPELYFVALGPDGRQTIARAVSSDSSGFVVADNLVDVDDAMAEIKDLRVSPRGNRLSYLLTSASRATSELHVVDLDGGPESIPVREGTAVILTCPGWTMDDSLVLLRSDERMTLVDVLMVKDASRVSGVISGKPIGQVRDVDIGSLSLDPRRRILYFTRTVRAIHSLQAFLLDRREERLIRSGELHGGVFSGIRVIDDRRLLFSLQKSNSDIYGNRLDRQ